MIYSLWVTEIEIENIVGGFAGPVLFGYLRGDTASGVFPASTTSTSLAFGVDFGLRTGAFLRTGAGHIFGSSGCGLCAGR